MSRKKNRKWTLADSVDPTQRCLIEAGKIAREIGPLVDWMLVNGGASSRAKYKRMVRETAGVTVDEDGAWHALIPAIHLALLNTVEDLLVELTTPEALNRIDAILQGMKARMPRAGSNAQKLREHVRQRVSEDPGLVGRRGSQTLLLDEFTAANDLSEEETENLRKDVLQGIPLNEI